MIDLFKEKKFVDVPNLDDGQDWEEPKCIKCEYNKKGYCEYFKCKRIEVKQFIYNCPHFEKNEEIRAEKLFGFSKED